jgi:type I restriction enzyme M protein
MEKSLGNKRRRIGDPSDKEKDPDHIGELTKIFGNFKDGQTRTFTEEDPITHQPVRRERVVSKIFDNEDFGYHKITVERPLRLNFQASAERIARLDDESGFKNLATSQERSPGERTKPASIGRTDPRIAAGFCQGQRREVLQIAGLPPDLREIDRRHGCPLTAESRPLTRLGADETAEICRDKHSNPKRTPNCATPRGARREHRNLLPA